jgi:hypothetical protein
VFLVTGGSSRFNCNEMNPFITSWDQRELI